MSTTAIDDPLMARAKALKLYGMLAHWEDIEETGWIASLIQWQEEERARRSLERRLGNAHLMTPWIVGFGLGAAALGGMLAGPLLGCLLLALTMANAGGAWDNAKKHVEKGHHGGKGSETHKATVVGDTVGNPFKDTSGPLMNILINMMAIVSLVIAPKLGSGLLGLEDSNAARQEVRSTRRARPE
jgi:hypothetical protein